MSGPPRGFYQQAGNPWAGVPYWAVGEGMPLLGDLTPNLDTGIGGPNPANNVPPQWPLMHQWNSGVAGGGPYAPVSGGGFYGPPGQPWDAPPQPPTSFLELMRALVGGR